MMPRAETSPDATALGAFPIGVDRPSKRLLSEVSGLRRRACVHSSASVTWEGRLELLPDCSGAGRDHFTLGIDFYGGTLGLGGGLGWAALALGCALAAAAASARSLR